MKTEDCEEYERCCEIGAEYCRLHPEVTVACALDRTGGILFMLGILGETKKRGSFVAERGSSRAALFAHFDDLAGLATDVHDSPPPVDEDDESGNDDWDW